MKLMSARSSCAPAPISTAKREPAIFVARSKSMMPSSVPSSQCAFGSKSKTRGSPHVRTTDISARRSSRPARCRAECSGWSRAAGALMLDGIELDFHLLDAL